MASEEAVSTPSCPLGAVLSACDSFLVAQIKSAAMFSNTKFHLLPVSDVTIKTLDSAFKTKITLSTAVKEAVLSCTVTKRAALAHDTASAYSTVRDKL